MIILDYNDKRPIYEQIVDKMQALIAGGVLEPDSKLPSVRSLAVELSINPNTIQRAYSELERSGFIYSVKGRGNFVRADEHLKEKQQNKLLRALEKQLITCREQGITRENIISSVDKVYEKREDSVRRTLRREMTERIYMRRCRMIEIKNVSKSFGEIQAVSQVSLTLKEQNVFGMLGTNGAGKSTLLRMMAGVMRPDEGEILIDGENVWDNPEAKRKIFYISDDQFFFPNTTAEKMADVYSVYYPGFDRRRFMKFLLRFGLDGERKIQTFSKGMKKQLSLLLGICANVSYLLCDETFDGLDPVMRQGIKGIFAKEIDEKGLTPVIASHNLRELEDICDHIGLLHKGGVLLSKDLEDLKWNLHKIQCVLPEELDESLKESLDILSMTRRGKLLTLTVRGSEEEILSRIGELQPVFMEALPLSLEEIFISETEVVGYDIKNIVF